MGSRCFARMLQPYGISIGLKEHSNPVTPKAYTPKSPLGPLPPDSNTAHELYNTHDLTLVFGFLREIKMLQCEGFSSKLRYDFEIPNGENVRNWVANMILKFHDNPTVNVFEIVVFLRQMKSIAVTAKASYTPLVYDHSAGDTICSECGFDDDDNDNDQNEHHKKESSLSAPLLTSGAGLSTSVAHTPSNSDLSIKNHAKELYKKAQGRKIFKWRRHSRASMMACLYLACQEEGFPRTVKEIQSVAGGAKEKQINKAIGVGKNYDKAQALDIGECFCSELGLANHVIKAVREVLHKAHEFYVRRKPSIILATTIDMVDQLSSKNKIFQGRAWTNVERDIEEGIQRSSFPCVGSDSGLIIGVGLSTLVTHPSSYDNNNSDMVKTCKNQRGIKNANRDAKRKLKRDCNLVAVLLTMEQMANNLGLVWSIKNHAKELYKKAEGSRVFRGRRRHSRASMVACLYLACQEEEFPRTVKEMQSVSGGAKEKNKHINKVIGVFKKHFQVGRNYGKTQALDLGERLCTNLLALTTIEVLHKAQEFIVRSKPSSVLATTIYMVDQLSSDNMVHFQGREYTVKKVYRDLHALAFVMIPRWYANAKDIKRLCIL
ncbi:Transcription initiation factor IIB-2 [Glycine soja]